MKRKFPKLFYFLVCFLLIFEQSGFAQVAAELNLAGHFTRLPQAISADKFRPLHLRYLSYDSLNNNFNLFLDKGDLKEPDETSLRGSAKELLRYFFVGISLPNNSFWVNLRPDSPDNIIDSYLAQTDVGRILLEADLQLKKDTANFTSPQTPEGKAYWNKLYQKAGELFGSDNITIPTLTRPWIVPNEIIIRESTDNAYIYKATLKVMLEQDYLKDSSVYNFSDARLRQLNEYSSQLIRETVIPKLTKDINTAKRYAPLRQVYYSLILAQWFKQKFYGKRGLYSSLIDRRNLTGLISQETWSKNTYFQAYQKSFQEGEYNIKEQVYSLGAQTIRNYMSGGMNLTLTPGQIASSTVVSRRDMFRGVKNLVELVVAGSQAPNDLSDVKISRRDFLGAVAAVAATAALDPAEAQAIEYLAAAKPKGGAYNQYRLPSDKAYLNLLRQGLYSRFGDITDRFLKEAIEYSNSNNSLKFTGLAYELLSKTGLFSGKRYKILFFPGLKTTNKAIVLEDLNLILIGRDFFQWLKPGILERWLAIKILQEKTRIESKEKTILEREEMVHRTTLEAMEKMGGLPKDCLVIEQMLLDAFKAIKAKLGAAKEIEYDTSRQIMFNKKTGVLLVPFELRSEGKQYVFPISTGKVLVGDVYPNDEIDIFEMQEGFLLSSLVGAFAVASIQQPSASSAVTYFDADQNKGMALLKNDARAWVVFTDMLKLSLRNDYYGTNIADIFIADAIRIAKKVLSKRGGVGFRLGERSDEIAMVLPGSLQQGEVKTILQDIQGEIRREYLGYGIARLPDGMMEKIRGSDAIRMVQRTARERRGGGEEYITTALLVKDSGDIDGRLTLDRILKESGQIPGLGEVEEALPPYLPAGAARLRGEGVLEKKFEASLKEAEIFQRVAKQAGQIAGVEGLNARPQIKEGARLSDAEFPKLQEYLNEFEKSSRPLREFVKMRYDDNTAKQVRLDNGYAAFMRQNLYVILEYAIEKMKSRDSFVFAVRGPPDNFYIITSARGKWQITAVRQNILTAEGSSLEKNFLSIIEGSGRKLRSAGKFPFKVINDFDELGHYFGNQLIKLDNVHLLDAFNNQMYKAKDNNGILDTRSISEALSAASGNINNLLSENGFDFSVNFEAVSVTSDDFSEDKIQSAVGIARAALDILEKLNASRKTVETPVNSVKFYSEYQGRWQEVDDEIGLIAAKRATNAQAGLKEAHKNIGMPGETSASSPAVTELIQKGAASSAIDSFMDRVNKGLLENPQYPMRMVEVANSEYGLRDPNEAGLGLHGTALVKLRSILENGLGVGQEAKAVFLGINQNAEPFTQNEAYLSFGNVDASGQVILIFDAAKVVALSKWDAGKRIAVDIRQMKNEPVIGIVANIEDKEEIKNIVGNRRIPIYFFEPKFPGLKNLSGAELRDVLKKVDGIEQENYDVSLRVGSPEEQKRIVEERRSRMRELLEQMSPAQLNELARDFLEQELSADNRRIAQFAIDPFSPSAIDGSLKNKLIAAINSGQVIRLGLNHLSSGADKYSQVMSVFNLLEETLSEGLSSKLKVTSYDLKNAVRELLMNAFLHE
jgi:GGDEF domain-containing protein